MKKAILIINCGSSSLKYKVFIDDVEVASGVISNIGLESSAIKHIANGQTIKMAIAIPDHAAAIAAMIQALTNKEYGVIESLDQIAAVGHRVLHGGTKITKSVIVNEEIKKIIRECIPLGPLHNPANLLGIETCQKMLENIPQVAVFDTAFHQTMPEKAYLYPIPYKYYEKYEIRRFGFHGTSHRYLTARALDYLNLPAEGSRMIICHLGNGSSLSAIRDGKCIDTTMGLTPLEGLMMGTRCGSIDPAVVATLCEKLEMPAGEVVEKILNKESGLLGIAGTPDMVEVNQLADEKHNKKAILAREMLAYSIKKHIGALATALGGLDAIIFSGGIGENSNIVREMVAGDLPEFFGVKLNRELNASIRPGSGFEGLISTEDSRVKVAVIPTNEELMIARDTMALISEK